MNATKQKRIFQDKLRGTIEVHSFGTRVHAWADLYHYILTLTWPRFFALLAGVFLSANLLFALLYWLCPGSVANARQGSFLDLFFFSIETLATVGYGEMAPATTTGHVIAAFEILTGMFFLAILTGLIFARFSRPVARVMFSDKVVIREFDGGLKLMLRVANERHNRIMEPQANLQLVRREKSAEGEEFFRLHHLKLQHNRNPVFTLTWSLIHAIDESSPLYGWDKEALLAAKARIVVSIFGHDETIADSVHALHEYGAHQIFFDHNFADVISITEQGVTVIDLTRFHDIAPVRKG